MTPERWAQIEDLLHRALEQPAEARPGYVRDACADDSALGREVCSLLDAAGVADCFLDAPVAGGVRSVLETGRVVEPLTENAGALVGERFGPYVILSVIASGGMGTVYAARRADDAFEKRVAIKVARPPLDESQPGGHAERLARFAIERQVLADLDHPCIARLLDGGATPSGAPYFVMEFVDGVPIDAYCERGRLGVSERGRLFLRVCDAVREAHQRLILHRDIKPGNILVRADGTPKLLDFGLAKLMDPGHTAEFTHSVDGRFMGTIAYAAPEQLTGAHAKQDTRTDIYALGLVLYRLLAGRHAYPMTGTMTEVLARITDVIPDPPSTHVHTIPADLDTVVLKALAKEPSRRYQSVGEFAADVERALVGDAVLARADSRWYMLRKTVRSYRGPIATAAALLVLLAAFGGVMANQASRLADRSAELTRALRSSNIARARALAATGSVTEAEKLLWREYLSPLARPHDEAYWALWELYAERPALRTTDLALLPGDMASPTPDGSRLLACEHERGAVLLNLQDGSLLRVYGPHTATTRAVALSADAASVVVGDDQGALHTFRIDDGVETATLSITDAPIISVTRGPGGSYVCATLNSIVVANPFSGEPPRTIDGIPGDIRHAIASPDGARVFAACNDGHVRAYDTATGLLQAAYLQSPRWTSTLAISRDGRTLVADTDGADVAVIDLESGRVVRTLRNATGWVRTLRIQPDSRGRERIIASSFDKSAYLWDLETGALLHAFPGLDVPLIDAFILPDGEHIAAIGGRLLREWEIEPERCFHRRPAPGNVFYAAYTPDGSALITANAGDEETIAVWEARAAAPTITSTGHTNYVVACALDLPRGLIYSASYDGTVRASPFRGEGPGKVIVDTGGVALNSLALSPDGRTLAVGGDNGMLRLHHLGAETETISIGPASARIPSIQYTPDGRFIAAAVTGLEQLVLIDTASHTIRRIPAHSQTIRALRVNPAGTIVATAGDDRLIRLWSLKPGEAGRLLRTLRGHEQDIFTLDVSPDGTMIASAGRAGVIKLWGTESGACLLTLRPHTDMVFTLAFSPDGHTLVSAGRDRSIVQTDLTYYDSHIRGNLDHERGVLAAE
ncbi:MAG: protein kinase [Phycisphaeraceae bacterium]|nr:MAG: protein kinase [Phycisphaeraceae bacterium]